MYPFENVSKIVQNFESFVNFWGLKHESQSNFRSLRSFEITSNLRLCVFVFSMKLISNREQSASNLSLPCHFSSVQLLCVRRDRAVAVPSRHAHGACVRRSARFSSTLTQRGRGEGECGRRREGRADSTVWKVPRHRRARTS